MYLRCRSAQHIRLGTSLTAGRKHAAKSTRTPRNLVGHGVDMAVSTEKPFEPGLDP